MRSEVQKPFKDWSLLYLGSDELVEKKLSLSESFKKH